MKSFLFTAKIAGLFALAMVAVLGTIFALFVHLAADEMVEELGRLRAYEGVATAEKVEAKLAELVVAGELGAVEAGFERPEILAILELESRARPFALWLHPGAEPEPITWRGPMGGPRLRWLELDGRRCRIVGPPSFETWVPVWSSSEATSEKERRRIGWLEVEGARHLDAVHRGFLSGLLQIGTVAFFSIAALAIYLTRPLRRMSRAMDRIAAGELDHRVAVRGGDEVARMGRSFNTMANRIAGMLAAQKELMAGVSHELRSPLTRMRLALELLRDELARDGPSPTTGEAVGGRRIEQLVAEVDALDALVGELLSFSRLELGAERGGMALAPVTVDLAEAARRAWGRVEDEARAVGTELRLDLAPEAREVMADRRLLERLLGNLFENGVRHAGRGELLLATRPMAGSAAEPRVELRVADGGPGVPEPLRERLFEPFFRADPSRSRGTGGVGLGLMIVRRVVEAHGGRVTARASEPGGLEIVFDLPAAPGSAEA